MTLSNTRFAQRGIFQQLLGPIAREDGRGPRYDRATNSWTVTFADIRNYMSTEKHSVMDYDITKSFGRFFILALIWMTWIIGFKLYIFNDRRLIDLQESVARGGVVGGGFAIDANEGTTAVANGGPGGITIVVAGTGIVAGTGAAAAANNSGVVVVADAASVADVTVSVVADPSAAGAASAATTGTGGADVNSEDSGNEESEWAAKVVLGSTHVVVSVLVFSTSPDTMDEASSELRSEDRALFEKWIFFYGKWYILSVKNCYASTVRYNILTAIIGVDKICRTDCYISSVKCYVSSDRWIFWSVKNTYEVVCNHMTYEP